MAAELSHPDSERIVTNNLYYVLEHCRGPDDREHCLGKTKNQSDN
jgi:hypothetical protein